MEYFKHLGIRNLINEIFLRVVISLLKLKSQEWSSRTFVKAAQLSKSWLTAGNPFRENKDSVFIQFFEGITL